MPESELRKPLEDLRTGIDRLRARFPGLDEADRALLEEKIVEFERIADSYELEIQKQQELMKQIEKLENEGGHE